MNIIIIIVVIIIISVWVFNNWVIVILAHPPPSKKKPLQICPPPSRSLIGRFADWPLFWLAESFLLALRVEPTFVVSPAAEMLDGVAVRPAPSERSFSG